MRVLHIEDSEEDHALVSIHLRRGGIDADIYRIDTEDALIEALDEDWDLILSDYNIPGFGGLQALEKVRGSGKLVPFILVSGEIGEDIAVQAMRNGANDYLLKSNLARLAPAAMLAMEANRTRIEKRKADLALSRSRQQLRELAQHLQASIERERAAIAREVHDDVGGSLTAVKLDLAWIARHTDNTKIAERVQQALETVQHAHEASQRIMHNLRPAILEQGLVPALHWMTDRFGKRTGIEATFRTSQESYDLPAGVPLVAYRFAQEALTNVSKHAQASKVSVDITQAGGVLSIEVTDNGKGLSPEDLAKARSFGIRGLHERAETAGGWVDISSNPDGTTLILSVPLSGPENGFIDPLMPLTGEPAAETDPDDPTKWGTL
ncbi:hybrid sensor histidine kinase/response regulator [Aquabacterium sp.]|uniref:hybrid sensor histidine kinase/response regulator n=1 Tax=Aquabacterium sp. TaxID=1872578 RepID=UPI0039C86E0F